MLFTEIQSSHSFGELIDALLYSLDIALNGLCQANVIILTSESEKQLLSLDSTQYSLYFALFERPS